MARIGGAIRQATMGVNRSLDNTRWPATRGRVRHEIVTKMRTRAVMPAQTMALTVTRLWSPRVVGEVQTISTHRETEIANKKALHISFKSIGICKKYVPRSLWLSTGVHLRGWESNAFGSAIQGYFDSARGIADGKKLGEQTWSTDKPE